jgi:hypothetical protein
MLAAEECEHALRSASKMIQQPRNTQHRQTIRNNETACREEGLCAVDGGGEDRTREQKETFRHPCT